MIKTGGQFIRTRIAVLLCLLLAGTFSVSAQGWREYADQIKREHARRPQPAETAAEEPAEAPVPPKDETPNETPPAAEPAQPAPFADEPFDDPTLLSDAAIRHLASSAPGVIWAVGDRGAVWTTLDGGEKWFLVKVPTGSNLHSVSFADANRGLIAGGTVIPGTPNGRGVILRTADGGRTWETAETPGFPILRHISFRGDGTAEAWGDSSELYPSGKFVSTDGGVTWESSEKTNRHDAWRQGDSDAESEFAGLGVRGTPLRNAEGAVEPIPEFSGTPFLRGFTHAADSSLLFAGRNGTLLRWSPGSTPERLKIGNAPFDFETLAVSGPLVAAAGTPGTRIFISSDHGGTWRAAPTGVTVPIHTILFTDSLHGWAAGEFGNILATTDGGTTWTVQREGGRRAGWFGVFENAAAVPYEWIAALSAKEGWLGTVAAVTSNNDDCLDELSEEERLGEALLRAGGSGISNGLSYPAPPQDLSLPLDQVLGRWNRELGGDSQELLYRELVRSIRMWRPTLLLVSGTSASAAPSPVKLISADEQPNRIRPAAGYTRGFDPIKLALLVDQQRGAETTPSAERDTTLNTLIRETVFRAVRDAADPSVFPDQIAEQGLPPWKTERVGVAAAQRQTLSVKPSDYIPALGTTVEECAEQARKFAGVPLPSVRNLGMEIYTFDAKNGLIPQENAQPLTERDADRGTESRRAAPIRPQKESETLPLIRNRRRLLALADHLTGTAGTRAELLRGNLDETLQGADSQTAARFLLRLGTNLIKSGDPDSASEILERLISEYPGADETREAAGMLIRSYAGLERVRRVAVGRSAENRTETVTRETVEKEAGEQLPAIIDRASDAVRIGAFVQENFPELYMCPEIRFPLASAQRRAQSLQSALGYYFNRAGTRPGDRVGKHAAGEYALLNGNGKEEEESPMAERACAVSPGVPYLDGVLEPELWEAADTISLTGTGTAPESDAASLSILYDAEYLYLGIHAQSNRPSRSAGPRRRDGDLTESDRIEIALDPDRDFAGFYRFQIDRRGWITDSCQGDTGWNTRIYAANRETPDGWTVEMAIPWTSLCDRAPSSGNVWGLAVRRVTPGTGISVWTGDSAAKLEDGFGYLRFQ